MPDPNDLPNVHTLSPAEEAELNRRYGPLPEALTAVPGVEKLGGESADPLYAPALTPAEEAELDRRYGPLPPIVQ